MAADLINNNSACDKNFPGNALFSSALLDPDLAVPSGIVDPQGNSAPKRFNVYRNNVVSSLMEAMAQTYPAILQITGEENFATLSRIYISQHPPKNAVMAAYGDQFPQFIRGFEPLRNSPFLYDLALLEKTWLEAYHARDAQILPAEALGEIDPAIVMNATFVRHPAVALIKSDYALSNLFSFRAGEPDEKLDMKTPQCVLVTRPNLIVETHCLNLAVATFFDGVLTGDTLHKAIERAMSKDEEFDPTPAISMMLTSGSLTKISTPNPTKTTTHNQ